MHILATLHIPTIAKFSITDDATIAYVLAVVEHAIIRRSHRTSK